MTDEYIILELRTGNTAVFKELYKHFPMIRSMILKNNGTEEDAKDLFQNALITFYKKSLDPEFELTAKISSYLYAVCNNNWKKKLTRDKSFQHADIDSAHHISSEEKNYELENNGKKSLKTYISEIFSTIGEPCSSILIMHEYQKLSMDEIARSLGYANAHTVRNQKYKCILKMRKLIPIEVKNTYLNHE